MTLDLDTPAVLIDLDIAERNIDRYQAYADQHGLRLRPHIKTHKLPALARRQIAAGAIGITCQKISEAEAMIDGAPEITPEITDVLLTYNIVGTAKLARLKALAERVRLSVVADSAAVIEGLSAAFAAAPSPLTVLVECDTGAHRCGVASPEAAVALAQQIDRAPGLLFGGFMTYPANGGTAAVEEWMGRAKALALEAGLTVATITSGGSPDMFKAHEAPITSEYRPGTYVYNDRSLVARQVATWDDCALTVVATVVSVPAANRAIIDAGSKILTSDLLGLTGHGHVLGRPDLRIDQLSEEHGRLTSDGPIALAVGDQLRIVPNHACVVSNMVDRVHLLRQGELIGSTEVTARGKVI